LIKKRLWITLTILAAGMTVVASTVHANTQKDTITWFFADFPPISIVSGKDAGEGYSDRQTRMIQERLADYEPRYEIANFERITHEIKMQKKACCASLLKNPDRETYMEFSIPRFNFSHTLIIKKSERNKFTRYMDKNGKISLSRLLDDQALTLGVSQGRSYTKELDIILEKHKDSPNLLKRSGEDVLKGLISMLIHNRVDCAIGFPNEVLYIALQSGQADEITSLPIAELVKEFTEVYVGCPKNQWGATVIQKVNEILKDIRFSDRYLGYYEKYLDGDSKIRFRKFIDEYRKTEQ
jgi:uncharacterized protein (TIGR02285 family)